MGGVARGVGVPIGADGEFVAGGVPPAAGLVVDPEPAPGLDAPAAGVLGVGGDAVPTARQAVEGDLGLALGVGGHLLLRHDFGIGVVAPHRHRHGFVGHGCPVVGAGCDLGHDRLPRLVAVLFRGQRQAEGVPVDRNRASALDRLPAGVGDGGHEGVGGILAQAAIGGEGGRPAAGAVGSAPQFGDLLAARRLPPVPVRNPAEDLEHHVGTRHRLPEEVAGLDRHRHVVAGHGVGERCCHIHLVLGLAVSFDAERLPAGLAIHVKLNVVGAHGRLGGQREGAVHRAEVVGEQRLGAHRVVPRVPQGGRDGLRGFHGGVGAVLVATQDGGEVDGVPRPVDGPVGVEVDAVRVGSGGVPPPVPVAAGGAPGAVQPGHGDFVTELADGQAGVAGPRIEGDHTVSIRRALGDGGRLIIVQGHGHAGGRRLILEPRGPGDHFAAVPSLQGQHVPADHDEHLVLAGVGVAGHQHVDTRGHRGQRGLRHGGVTRVDVVLLPGGHLGEPRHVDGFILVGVEVLVARGEVSGRQCVQRKIDADARVAGPDLGPVAAIGID